MNKNKVSKDKGVQNTSIDKSAVYSKSLDKHVRASVFNHESVIRWLSHIQLDHHNPSPSPDPAINSIAWYSLSRENQDKYAILSVFFFSGLFN